VHENALIFWDFYPRFIRDLFTQVFTRGLVDPHSRVVETEWRQALSRLRDAIYRCAECGAENIYDAESANASSGTLNICWNTACGAELRLPPRLRVGRHLVMLNPETQLFPHHVDDDQLYVFSPVVAQVVRNPADPRIWGLKNLSGTTWTAIGPDGTAGQLAPLQSVRLQGGLRIQFGRRTGEIEVTKG
jgi:hypothetical protein